MKKYTKPIIKVIGIENTDIICTSNVDRTGLGTGYGPGPNPNNARGFGGPWDDWDNEE